MDNTRPTEAVSSHIHRDVPAFAEDTTVRDAMQFIRANFTSDRIAYFYVVDAQKRLTGVIPLRRLFLADLNQRVQDVVIRNVVSIPENATIAQAREAFAKHKYLALPVVDSAGRFLGIFDVTVITGSSIDFAEKQRFDEIFETIGVRYAMLKTTSPLLAFRYRFPWLIPTVLSGTVCALFAGFFEKTLSESLIIAFFLTMVLGLGESVSIQSLAITVRRLRTDQISFGWYFDALKKELATSLLLGLACGLFVALVVFIWKHSLLSSIAIGSSIILSLISACVAGLTMPAIIHSLKLDVRVAAGPLALAAADVCTLVFYLSLASIIL